MRKVLQSTKFKNFLTVEIEGLMKKNKIGDIITDNKNDKFKIASVVLMSGINVNRLNTNLIIEPLDEGTICGDMLDVE